MASVAIDSYRVELSSLYTPARRAKRTEETGPPLIAVSLIKNEGDIVSAWTAHLCALFDAIYIADQMSSDGTREFLLQLATNGACIHVYSFNHPGYFQEEITNRLAEDAAREYSGSWLFALDADEFLAVPSRADLLARIRAICRDRVLRMRWRNCVPVCLTQDAEFDFALPCLISPEHAAYEKLAIHSSALLENHWRFHQGNHQIFDDTGSPLPDERELDLADLLHVPLRSVDHFVLKCVQGCEAYNSLPRERNRGGQGFHWFDMVSTVMKRKSLDPDAIRAFVARYGGPGLSATPGVSTYDLVDAGWVCAPLEVAHVEPWLRALRRYRFSELANQTVAAAEEKDLLVEFLQASQKRFVQATPRGRGEKISCGARTTFGRLPQARATEAEARPELEMIRDFISQLFTPHERPVASAWESHVPFLFCLLHYTRPRRFVELGTQFGNCFFAACQASREMGYGIECVAIDTWRGDRHTGRYGENVFRQFARMLDLHYRSCGKYIRATFDEALHEFEEGSIDLLHIDGLHTYEAASHDFGLWLPKMSDRGIMMLHDTRVRDRNFGVWRLWAELERLYPSFEFKHGNGLGVLLVGDSPPASMRALFDAFAKRDCAELVRFLFSGVGITLSNRDQAG